MTKNFQVASTAAICAAYEEKSTFKIFKGKPKHDAVIFQIKVPKGTKMEQDEMHSKAEKCFRIPGNIPKEWITGYIRIGKKKLKEEGVSTAHIDEKTGQWKLTDRKLHKLAEAAQTGFITAYVPWLLDVE